MSGGPALDEETIRRLAALLEETGLSEIEIGEDSRRVRVARTLAAPAPPPPAPAPAAEAAAASGAADAGAADGGEAAIDASHPGAVVSPMVGTLYTAPGPGERPFVVEGGTVAEGETMFIIEAMKTMNPVRAPRGGTVARILAANGAPVEYGQALAVVA